MAKRRCVISFELSTTGTFDNSCESIADGRVRAWMSRRVSSQCTTVRLSPTKQTVRIAFVVSRTATDYHVSSVIGRSKLNLQAMEQFKVHEDEWCDKGAGETSIYVTELLSGDSKTLIRPGYVMGVSSESYLPKTMFHVSNFCVTYGDEQLVVNCASLKELLAAEHERELKLRAYVYSCHHLFDMMRCTYAFAKRINAYIIKYHQRMLPTIAYMCHSNRNVRIEPGYFENLLDTALRAEWISREDLLALPLGAPQLSNIFAWMCMIYTNHVIYTSDETRVARRTAGFSSALMKALHINAASDTDTDDAALASGSTQLERVNMEQMALVEHTHGAEDCEGSGGKTGREAKALIRYSQTPQCTDELIRRLGQTGQTYVFWDILCSVTTGDIGGTVEALSSATEMGAHIFCFAQPLYQTIEAMQRCSRPGMSVFCDAPDSFATLVQASRRMIPLFLEGTGVSMPGPTDLPSHNRLWLPPNREKIRARDCEWGIADRTDVRWINTKHTDEHNSSPVEVEDNNGCRLFGSNGSFNPGATNNALWLSYLMTHIYSKGFRGTHRMYTWRAGESHFYRTLEIGMTTSLLDKGFPVSKAVFCQRDTSSGDGAWTKGVDLETAFSDRLGLWREPAMDRDEILAVREEVDDEQPLIPLQPPPKQFWKGRLDWDDTWRPPTQQQFEQRCSALGAVQDGASRCIATVLPSIIANYSASNTGKWNMIGSLFACRDSVNCDCGARRSLERALKANSGEWALLFRMDPDGSGAAFLSRLEAIMAGGQGDFYGHPVAGMVKYNNQLSMQSKRQQGMLDALSVPIGIKWDDQQKILIIYGPPHISEEQATPDCGGIALWTPALILY